MTLKEHLDFLKRISQKVANWPAWRRSGIVPEENLHDQFITKSGGHVAVGWKKPLLEDFVSSGKEYVGWQPPSADGFISNCKEWDSLVARASRKLEEDITEAKLEEGGPTIPSENLKRVFRKVINAFSQEISYENILPGVFLKDDGAVAFVMQKDKHRVEIEIRESIEGQLSEKFKAVLADAEKTLEAIRTGNLD
jgi:hypothetical protein